MIRYLCGALLLAAAAVTGCRPAEVIPPPEDSIVVQATSDPLTPAFVVTIPAQDEVVFDLVVPSPVAGSSDVYYVELDVNLPLELRRSSNYGVLAASSSGPSFFASGSSGLSSAAEAAGAAVADGISQQAIGVSRVCGGSCVIRPVGEKLHARVRNTTGSPQEVTLYFFGDVFQDDGESANNTRAGAPNLGSADQGAIELIGDVDFWRAPSRRDVTLTQGAGALSVRAVVVNANGVAVSGAYQSGDTFEVCEGYFVRVTAAISSRAAAPGTSLYTLESTLLAPDPNCGVPDTVAISASTNPSVPRHATTLGPGEALFLDMSISSGVQGMPVVYFELSADLRLELRNAANTTTIASSSSKNFFASGGSGLMGPLAHHSLLPQGITTSVACRGSCVIFPAGSSAYVGLVINEGGSPVSFNVYLYGSALMDTGEPHNNVRATAPLLSSSDDGAIETLGDIDFYRTASTGSVDFDPVGGIALVADIYNAAGAHLAGPYAAGSSIPVLANEYIGVRAQNSGMAAAAARSRYFLSYGAGLSEAEVYERRSR